MTPPPILWTMGDVSFLHRPVIAMVGARNASSLGTRMARALAHDLGAQGYVVVSGLARGVDAAAHLAALKTGTIAVMAGGVDVIYPSENTQLAHDIAAQGLRISEQPARLSPQARHFPRRNRIISGLAQAVVVVEAAAKSGSLITARDALDQGREVLAVPGHPFDARAAGCNHLIRDGAQLVRNAEDVIAALPAKEPSVSQPDLTDLVRELPQTPQTRNLRDTAQLHGQILNRLGPSPIAEDQLIRDLGAAPRRRRTRHRRSGTGRQDPAAGRRAAGTSPLTGRVACAALHAFSLTKRRPNRHRKLRPFVGPNSAGLTIPSCTPHLARP